MEGTIESCIYLDHGNCTQKIPVVEAWFHPEMSDLESFLFKFEDYRYNGQELTLMYSEKRTEAGSEKTYRYSFNLYGSSIEDFLKELLLTDVTDLSRIQGKKMECYVNGEEMKGVCPSCTLEYNLPEDTLIFVMEDSGREYLIECPEDL